MTDTIALVTDVIQIGWINILLSVDNAIMIALACCALPEKQRRIGIALGAGGAVAMRVLFTLVLAEMLDVPGLRVAGGLCVIYLAAKLPFQSSGPPDVEAKRTLFSAIGSIIVADAMLSLDNSLALAAAAHGSKPLIVFGLALSAPLVVFGAKLLSALIARLPALVWLGAALLGWAGGQLIAGDPAWTLLNVAPPSEYLAGAIACVMVLAASTLMLKHRARVSAASGQTGRFRVARPVQPFKPK